jgi:hypothetical protein
MIERNAERFTVEEERREIVRIVSSVSVTGEAAERGRMLDVLAKLEPRWRSGAPSLTLSSNTNDRLEGIERLWRPQERRSHAVRHSVEQHTASVSVIVTMTQERRLDRCPVDCGMKNSSEARCVPVVASTVVGGSRR